MDAAVNDKNRFISSITDTITLFSRLALKHNRKIKLDGCLAFTVDDDKTVVVNLNKTVLGQNTKTIYPSLRVNGKDGQTYVLLKDKSTTQTNPLPISINRTVSQQPTPVIAGRTTSLPQVQVLKSTGTAHLLISPPKVPLPTQRKPTPVIIVSPRKDQPSIGQSFKCMQSLLTGQRFIQPVSKTPTTAVPHSGLDISEQSAMGSKINVLQSRVPELQPVEQVAVKSEPEDQSLEQSEDVSRQITQFFSGELEGGDDNQDKENSTGGSSRRSSTHIDGPPEKRQRTNSEGLAAVPMSQPDTHKTHPTNSGLSETESTTDSPSRRSCRMLATKTTRKAVDLSAEETSTESESDHAAVMHTSEESTDNEYESEDDILSTATSEDEVEELYQCSEKFSADCAKKIKTLNGMLESLRNEMSKKGSDWTKEMKQRYTRSSNVFQRSVQEFDIAKSKGSSDIKATENKLEKDFGSVMEHFQILKQRMGPAKKSKPQPGKKAIIKPKPTSSSVKHTNKVLKNAKAKVAESKAKVSAEDKALRVRRVCGECAPCKKESDCGKCKFCKDKVKYGGNNTLRQKCIKKQCMNKGGYIIQGKGKNVTARPR